MKNKTQTLSAMPMKFRFACHLVMIALSAVVVTSCSDDEKVNRQEASSTHQDKQENKSYSAHIIPEKMTVQEKKQRFAYLVAPAIKEVHAQLMKQYKDVSKSVLDGTDDELIEGLKKAYKATNDQDLLKALKPHPQSIGLAQAAMESAWGTSRFFREANNIFGVWSFDKDEPRIAASQKRAGKTVWVKKYPSIKTAVKDYYRVLARSDAFYEFRSLKMKTSDPYELVKKLDRYSERGDAYGKELAAMIRFNKFDAYDL